MQEIPSLSELDIDLDSDGVVHNYTDKGTQLMNGKVPWRGPREKDPAFMGMLIQAFTKTGDVVVDFTASTGVHSSLEWFFSLLFQFLFLIMGFSRL